MEGIVEHLRVFVFENGEFLKLPALKTPNGVDLDQSLLKVKKVFYFSLNLNMQVHAAGHILQ